MYLESQIKDNLLKQISTLIDNKETVEWADISEKILEAQKPKAFLLENVKRLVNHDNGKTFTIIKERRNKSIKFVN